MPLFKVKIPIAGFAEGSFEADTEDEAVEAALNEFAEDDWDNDIWELDFDSYGTETEATGPLAELQVTLDLGVPPENAEGPESEEDEEPEDGDLEDDA